MSIKFKSILSYTLGALLVISTVALAGNLAPTSSPAPTMITLSNIYSKIQNINYSAASSDHTLSTSSSPIGTFSTLAQIYQVLDDLNYTASDIATGTSIMGVTGNITIPAATDVRLNTTYGSNNSLTGSMSVGITAPQWSADFGSGSYSYTDSAAYCSSLDESSATDWRLPTLGELLLHFELSRSPSFTGSCYWSSKQSGPTTFWWAMPSGGLETHEESTPACNVRCAR